MGWSLGRLGRRPERSGRPDGPAARLRAALDPIEASSAVTTCTGPATTSPLAAFKIGVSMPLPGELVQQLETAGQADVWLARDSHTGSDFVVKILREDPDPQQAIIDRQRFQREIRIQSQLRHPGIMPILNFGTADGDRFWYAMPLASYTLQDMVSGTTGGLDPDSALGMLLILCEIVEFAHGEGVLHRDLKPANVLWLPAAGTDKSRWVVADFGLSRDSKSDSAQITKTRTVIGTVGYMAPEQYDSAHDCTETADVFALGKILLFCLTGAHPFPYAHVEKAPSRFRYIISRCIADEPGERYESVGRLRAALTALIANDDTFANEADHAKSLIAAILNDDPVASEQLGALLLRELDNDALLIELIPLMQFPVVESISSKISRSDYARIVRGFDRVCEGSHPFSFTDRIADLLSSFLFATDDYNVRRLTLRRIMMVGADHNRFYVRDTFWRVVKSINPEETMLVTDLLRENPGAAAFLLSELPNFPIPRAIRELAKEL